jgi:S-DNA-T family DNA segregation ATPase FtsK/SpoIIIE
MPYIVVIIDEFGDLIMTAGKEIELPIARIAQLARAVGIHMVIATQRPTTRIITGNIKANFPGRIAFKTSARIDSMTILDQTGANQLIGRGDMLYFNGGELIRVQCAFVDTPEVEKINHFIEEQPGPVEPLELPEPSTDETGGGDGAAVDVHNLDPLFEEAARHIVLTQQGSTSMIQRRFSIGYNRAGRLMDQLQEAGIVGEAMGSKPREVLITDPVSLDNLFASLHR